MKTFVIVVGIFFVGMLGSTRIVYGQPEPKPTTNLVVNGGFEEWRDATEQERKAVDCVQFPDGLWHMVGGTNFALTRDDKVKHGGNCSLRVENKDTKSSVYVIQRIDAEPETRYRIRMWLKGENIDAYHPKGVLVHAVASSYDNKKDPNLWAGNLHYEGKAPSPNTGTFDWKELDFTFDVPLQTRTILIDVELRGAGTMWLDDVEVIKKEKVVTVESF